MNHKHHKPPAYLSIGIGILLILIATLTGCKKPEPIIQINGIERDNIVVVPDWNDAGLQALISSRSNEPLTLWSLKPQNNVIGTSPTNSSIITKQRILRPQASALIDGQINGMTITPFTTGSDYSGWSWGSDLPGEWLNNYRSYSDSTVFGTVVEELFAVGKVVQEALNISNQQLIVSMVQTNNPYPNDFRLVHKYGFILQTEAVLTGHVRFRTINNQQYTPAPVSVIGGCADAAEYVHNYNAVPNLVRICDFEDYGLSVEFGFESGM